MHEAEAGRQLHQVAAVAQPELPVDAIEVGVDGLARETEVARDLLRHVAVGGQAKHLASHCNGDDRVALAVQDQKRRPHLGDVFGGLVAVAEEEAHGQERIGLRRSSAVPPISHGVNIS